MDWCRNPVVIGNSWELAKEIVSSAIGLYTSTVNKKCLRTADTRLLLSFFPKWWFNWFSLSRGCSNRSFTTRSFDAFNLRQSFVLLFFFSSTSLLNLSSFIIRSPSFSWFFPLETSDSIEFLIRWGFSTVSPWTIVWSTCFGTSSSLNFSPGTDRDDSCALRQTSTTVSKRENH